MAVWIGTSWKMNKLLAEAEGYAAALRDAPAPPGITRFVVPPFTCLRQVRAALDGTDIRVGAQNMHWDDAGAWTGEISAPMLVDCGADLVELGHSERRAHFGETDETVALKVEAALRHGLVPLVCIGETAAERTAGRADDVLAGQVEAALSRIRGTPPETRLLFAYEPVWAIGTAGTPASPDYVAARHGAIADRVHGLLGRSVPCLYGGSVTAENCAGLVRLPGVDGLFIGRAALSPEGYLDIVSRCATALAGAAQPH
ncbi:triose-phosphate isomerase [Wenxinia saemankumensis]|uniref:Triosephosphate isomerase n=1 Tax=Wenxinia saemankumensis TaxID=1447782 RepID=A0A1M5ZY50_9RHOB|nr:triose-phosphate isomerase [Wenxinia saemankumensis]SHI29181.1 triosephosphate isomerase [Wenxinia saemankumensis]